ncbi:MAG: M28 family peptidase [Treponema sp.]|nr:M28 family peptidase [Treponema sp.]
MKDNCLTKIIWRRFKEFIAPDANRFELLKQIIEEAALDCKVLELADHCHFFILPPRGDTSKLETPKAEKAPHAGRTILVAHYDRCAGSPGANDNSAGVFLLLETAMKLKVSAAKNWLVIFTDKEELHCGQSIVEQGAYKLAQELKQLGTAAQIFCFDACGTGDTLVISTTAEHLLKKEGNGKNLQRSVKALQMLAHNTAINLGMEKVLLAPTPFSDDAGFLRAGLAAQTITMLPAAECAHLVAELHKSPDLAGALINAELRQTCRAHAIPETWRNLNGPRDSLLRLTPQHFRAVIRFAQALCGG